MNNRGARQVMAIWRVVSRIGCAILLVLTLAVTAACGHLVYLSEYHVAEVGREVSPDGAYEVIFRTVGEPDWPFGAGKVRVIVKHTDGGVITRHNTTLHDDGVALHPHHWQVSWYGDRVEITLRASEQEDEVITVTLP